MVQKPRCSLDYKVIWLALAFLMVSVCATASSPIPQKVTKVVAFVFVPKNGTLVPYGTGFFVAVKSEKNPERSFGYFVTAKHVLRTPQRDSWYPTVYIRLNKQDGGAEFIEVPVVLDGLKKNVYTHQDTSVDLAIIPAWPDVKLFDYKFLPDQMITTEKDFKDLDIHEGAEIFFTGLFAPYVGTKKNYPIVRFGRVSLISDEKIKFSDGEARLYLIECGSFGGNSGSPVFFYLGADRQAGSLFLGPPILKLAGVMSRTFLDTQPLQVVETAEIPVAPSSMGIAAVVPANLLHEILFGEELKKQRGS
jgi:hypothetical protein